MRIPWRREPAGQDTVMIDRFGRTCPVCDAPLGAPPVIDGPSGRFVLPPCFRLEVGTADRLNRYPWRLSVVGGDFPVPRSTEPVFNPLEIEYVYLLCGGGHIFPDAAPVLHRRRGEGEARHSIHEWNMVAALGAPASGKTYLLLRMLHQNLDNPDNILLGDEEGRVRQYQLSPLEQIPMSDRAGMYAQTLATGDAIEPTMTNRRGQPEGILSEQLPDALDAIKDMIRRTVVDGRERAEIWGTRFRQPLVMRTEARGRRTWTGVADLPGELFDPDDPAPRERVKLRDYDALVWVVDPVVAAGPMDRFTEDNLAVDSSYDAILDGSLRPGTIAAGGSALVRTNRDHIQTEIGRRLTLLDADVVADQGAGVQVLVTVTKCDLIRAALAKKNLDELGAPGSVGRGAAGYLAVLTDRHVNGRIQVDPLAVPLLQYLYAGDAVERTVREQRMRQVADGLIRHYSDPDAFWRLVETGEVERVDIPSGTDPACRQQTIIVPSIGTHLDHGLRRDAILQVPLRDVVMSALGCGVAYGLGHEQALYRLLREEWIRLRFFLSSPLGTVPLGAQGLLKPLEVQARFPRLGDRSAALSQLLLAALGKARS